VGGGQAGDYRVVLELQVGVGDGRVGLDIASEALVFTVTP